MITIDDNSKITENDPKRNEIVGLKFLSDAGVTVRAALAAFGW